MNQPDRVRVLNIGAGGRTYSQVLCKLSLRLLSKFGYRDVRVVTCQSENMDIRRGADYDKSEYILLFVMTYVLP